MSLFNNDVRVANTATPSFNTQVNIGQYGWTESDHGRFNQLIQYVEQCKQYSDHMGDVVVYVEKIAKYISDIEPSLKGVENSIDTVKTYQRIVEADKGTVQSVARDITTTKSDFDTKYQTFLTSTAKLNYGVVFQPSWSEFGAGFLPVGAVRVGTYVKLQGLVSKEVGAGVVIGRLPDGAKPSGSVISLCPCNGGFVLVEISSEGFITVRQADSPLYDSVTWISLDNTSFYVD